MLVLKEGGTNVVEHEVSGKDRLKALLIEHKYQTLPQLRSSNAKSIGCQPGGLVQVCVVVMGVPGGAFHDAKGALRRSKLMLDSKRSASLPKHLSTLAVGRCMSKPVFAHTQDEKSCALLPDSMPVCHSMILPQATIFKAPAFIAC